VGRRSRSFDFPTRSRRPSAALASWTFPTETLMPWTAAACVMIVRMKDISFANVAEPTPCLACFLPNSIRRSRLSADSFTPPSSVLSDPITAVFDRRGVFLPRACLRRAGRLNRQTCERSAPHAAWTIRCGRYCAPSRARILHRPFAPSERLGHIPGLAADLDAPVSRCQSSEGRHACALRLSVHYVCTERSKRVQMCNFG